VKKTATKPAPKAAGKAGKTEKPKPACILRLYVAGATPRSQQAILRARELCETELDGDYELEVIDIYQQPHLAREGQILATPTLIKAYPPPVRRLIGNLSNTAGFFAGLDLTEKPKTAP